MTPGARLSAVIEALEIAAKGSIALHKVTDTYFRRRRYAGSKDRRAITAQIYRIVRHRARLEWWIHRYGSTLEVTPRTECIADLALNEKLYTPEICMLFNGFRHCPNLLSDAEAGLAQALAGRTDTDPSEMPEAVTLEYPEWLDTRLKTIFGDKLSEEMNALNQPAPVDLRVNMLKGTVEDARKSLKHQHIEPTTTPFSPIALRTTNNVQFAGTSAFRQGLIEIQDEASQIIALLTDARPGMTVVDFCAGAGGKTLALAASMARGKRLKGSLIACDVSSRRLDRMRHRLQRAGASEVDSRVLSSETDSWIIESTGIADRVLLDVPCTGTGTWRRSPDAKWRLQPKDLEKHRETQRSILTHASHLVRDGGWLVYATCSILQEENEQQVLSFLENSSDFRTLDATEIWQETIGGDCPVEGPWIRLSPATTGTDGFFCAVLKRDPQ